MTEGAGPPPADDFADAVARTEGLQPGRRVFHALNGIAIALVLSWILPDVDLARWAFGGLAAMLLVLDVIRLSSSSLNLTFFRLFRWFASPREATRIASSTWYIVGVLLLVLWFPPRTWIPAVLVLALGDPAASYVGRRWGTRRLGGGSVQGSAAFLVVTTLVVSWFCPGWRALAVALGVGAVEALPRFVVDDNVTIPLATAALMTVLCT